MWSFLAEGKEVKHPIVRDLRMFFKVRFESVQPFLLIGGRIHPYFNLIEALPNLDPDAVHDVDEFVLGTDGREESALPELVAFLFLYLYLKASAARVVDVLPHRLHPLLKQVHIAVYITHQLLVSSLVGFRNWKISQNYFTYEKVATSLRLDEYSSAFILSMSCTHRVKLFDNLKFDIIYYNRIFASPFW